MSVKTEAIDLLSRSIMEVEHELESRHIELKQAVLRDAFYTKASDVVILARSIANMENEVKELKSALKLLQQL